MKVEISDVIEQWKKDSNIEQTKLDKEIFRTPNLHAKYLEYYLFFKKEVATNEKNKAKLMWVKRKYFRGEMEREELQKFNWSQWQGLKPSAAELNQLLDMDRDLAELNKTLSDNKSSVSICEYILKQISQRDYSIKSAIEYLKYLSG